MLSNIAGGSLRNAIANGIIVAGQIGHTAGGVGAGVSKFISISANVSGARR